MQKYRIVMFETVTDQSERIHEHTVEAPNFLAAADVAMSVARDYNIAQRDANTYRITLIEEVTPMTDPRPLRHFDALYRDDANDRFTHGIIIAHDLMEASVEAQRVAKAMNIKYVEVKGRTT